jgi:hypothetical protein
MDSAMLRELYAYWDGKREGRAMPGRADLDPVEVPKLLPYLILFEVESDSKRLWVRLAGTEIVRLYGRDYTASYLDELDFGDQRQAVLADYQACVESGRPGVAHRKFWNIHGLYYRCERLILPLSDDGRDVNMILAGLDFEEVRGEQGK